MLGENNMARIEILPVGREILTGRISERNAKFIAGRVAAMGGLVQRITIVDDSADAIIDSMTGALERGTQFLVVCGGLGPSFDDVTMAAVAEGAGLELEINEEALEFVQSKYHEYFKRGHVPFSELTDEREKMAWLPQGAMMIPNPVGAAPGARFNLGTMEIFTLPGPPIEMEPMYLSHVEPVLARAIGKRAFMEKTVDTNCYDESVLTQVCRELTEFFPGLHAKSNPTFFGDKKALTVTFSVWCEQERVCRDLTKQAIDQLQEKLKK